MNEQSKNAEFIKILGISLIPLHLFFFYYPLAKESLHISFLNHIYQSLSIRLFMANSSILMNALSMFILLIYAITTPLGKDKELNKVNVVSSTIGGFIIIVVSALVFFNLPYNQWGFYIYGIGLGIGYYLYMSNIAIMLQLVEMNKTQAFNIEKETFPQMTEKIETPYSINIPYHFYYQKKWHKGWLNFVNPF